MWGDSGWQRLGLTTALVSIAYYLGAQIGFLLTFPSLPTSIFWLPNSTMLGVFLLSRRRHWWAYALAALPAHLAVQIQHHAPVAAMVPLYLTNVGDGLLAAAAMRRFAGGEPIFDSFKGVLVFVAFALAVPMLVSFLDAGIMVATGWAPHYWLVWYTRFCSNALTNLIWVPVLVIGLTRGLDSLRTSPWMRFGEASLLAVGLMVVGVAFGSAAAHSRLLVALLYAPLPLLLWGSARFGVGGEAAALLVFALLIVWNAIRGNGPFAEGRPGTAVLTLQVFLTALAIPMMLIASLWAERRRRESALRDRQAQYERAR
jgi:integral membrane sensor domain MASE1